MATDVGPKIIFQHRRPADGMLMSNSRSPGQDKPSSPKYSERLSPAINHYLSEAARHDVRVCLENSGASFFGVPFIVSFYSLAVIGP